MNFYPIEEKEPLKKFARNLNDEYLSNKLNKTIGREDEIRRIIEIISRREKNNPILIGEPGVGKTAIVEGLVERIINNDVPKNLKGCEIYEISLSSLMAGASFQGEFERRFNSLMNEVKKSDGKIIIFIDELHQLIGMGKTSPMSGMDAANIIKPLLARGEIKLIGATTFDEYHKFIEKDGALERRFQKITVNEPNFDETLTILRGLKQKWEIFHNVKILDSALIAAINMSVRYIPDKFLPDKAIDLIDEAAAKINTQINSLPTELDDLNRKLAQLEIERFSLEKEDDIKSKKRFKEINEIIPVIKNEQKILKEKWKYEKQLKEDINRLKSEIELNERLIYTMQIEGKYEDASKILYSVLPNLRANLSENEKKLEKHNSLVKNILDEDQIAEIISRSTKIPVKKIANNDKNKLMSLSNNLLKRIIGQNDAIESLTNCILRNRIGISNSNRPIGSFMFIGPTGVGKTELSKALAEQLFDDEKNIIRFDMSEFMEKHSISKLIGSPPGYVGYEQGGSLTELVKHKPYSVILFDEIEKANIDVLNILLQILDDGQLRDSKGKNINFKNTIIIMTSNVGSNLVSKSNSSVINNELKKHFKPEFINRIDEIILFNHLTKENLTLIIRKQLDDLKNRLNQINYKISFDESIIYYCLKNAYDEEYGARPIKRFINKYIESLIAKKIINSELKENVNHTLKYANDNIIFEKIN